MFVFPWFGAFFPVMVLITTRVIHIQSSWTKKCHGDLGTCRISKSPSRPHGPMTSLLPGEFSWGWMVPQAPSHLRPFPAVVLETTDGTHEPTIYATKVLFFDLEPKASPKMPAITSGKCIVQFRPGLLVTKGFHDGLERFQFGHCSGIIILRGDTSIYVNLT